MDMGTLCAASPLLWRNREDCISLLFPPAVLEQKGAGDRPFLTQISTTFTVLSRLEEFEEKAVIPIDYLFPLYIHMDTYIHYINAFKGRSSMKNN